MPLRTSYVFPRQAHTGLNSTVAEVDHDHPAIVILHPVPGHQILTACIVRPAATSTQLPFAVAKYRCIDRSQELAVEGLQFFVNGLGWPSSQKDRQPYLSTFKLSFIEEPCPGKRRHHDRGGLLLGARKR